MLLTAEPVAVELYLDAGLPGFPSVHRFRIEPWGGTAGPFAMLRCLDVEDLAFLIVRPDAFFADYEPAVSRDTADRLGLREAEDAAVYVIVTLGATPEEATVNLLGPIVVNRHTGRAAQIVLDGSRYDVRTPLRRS